MCPVGRGAFVARSAPRRGSRGWRPPPPATLAVSFPFRPLRFRPTGPNFSTVQHGFAVPDVALLPDTQAALQGYLAETVARATSLGVGTHDLAVPSGALRGVVARVTVAAGGEASACLPGGLWLVTGMWTQSGVNNPLASYQNMMIFTCWLIVFVGAASLCPPVRTLRAAVWRGMLPAALRDAAGLVRAHAAHVVKTVESDAREEPEGEACADSDTHRGEETQEADTDDAAAETACVRHIDALFDGDLAKHTFFEPRLLDNWTSPPECAAGYLVELSTLVAKLSAAAVGVKLFVSRDFGYGHVRSGAYARAADDLDACAAALATGDVGALDKIDRASAVTGEGGPPAARDEEDPPPRRRRDAFEMRPRTEEIVAVARKWLRAMSAEGGGGGAAFCSGAALEAARRNVQPVRGRARPRVSLPPALLARLRPFRRTDSSRVTVPCDDWRHDRRALDATPPPRTVGARPRLALPPPPPLPRRTLQKIYVGVAAGRRVVRLRQARLVRQVLPGDGGAAGDERVLAGVPDRLRAAGGRGRSEEGGLRRAERGMVRALQSMCSSGMCRDLCRGAPRIQSLISFCANFTFHARTALCRTIQG